LTALFARAARHGLFYRVYGWSAMVDDFLKAQNLFWLPEPVQNYLLAGPHKAFAMSEHRFRYSAAQLTVDMAKSKALDNCRQAAPRGEKCAVVSVDEAAQDEK
jgi:hypothetical protein